MNPPTDFTPILVDGREDSVRRQVSELGCDALVVTSMTNVRWLTGFTGSNAVVVVGPEDTLFFTDGRYTTQAPADLARAGSEAAVDVSSDAVAAAIAAVPADWCFALEDSVAWSIQLEWAAHSTSEPVPATDLIDELRSVKTPAELERMQAAAAIVDEALADAAGLLTAGITERTMALALDDGMRARGAQGPAYETIVASGPNAALPHARPTDREFEDGDLVIIDAGAVVDGYRSDMTRTFVIGEPTDRTDELVDVVTRSQAAGVAGVAPDVEAAEIDRICRDVIESADMGDAFIHGTGHGVGLDIHELPRVRKGSTAILRPGHVVTVEPGVYFPGVGGVRVEDTVVVTEDGCRALTRFPKSPVPD